MMNSNYFEKLMGKDKTPAIGIDLGTTNSGASIIREGVNPEMIPIEGRSTVPSCVSWMGGDNFIVGKDSYKIRYQKNSVYSIKRLMGTDETVTLEYNGEKRTFRPEEISAKILEKIVKEVGKIYGNIKDVVVTVPAKFNMRQLEATEKAIKLAGLNGLKLLKEPTSAAICSISQGLDEDKHILIYDLGGGTFDVSLVSATKSVAIDKDTQDFLSIYGIHEELSEEQRPIIEVIDQDGNAKLGGDDIDVELTNLVLNNNNINKEELTYESLESFILKIEDSKKSMANVSGQSFNFEFKLTNGEILNKTITIGNNDFIKATEIIYNKTKELVDLVFERNTRVKIDSIVLVGGSTKNVYIKEFLKRDYQGVIISDGLEPDESVALGAAIEAKNLKFGNAGVEIFDAIPLSIGVLADGVVKQLLPRNTVIPSTTTKSFFVKDRTAKSVSVKLYEGDSLLPSECTYLGEVLIPYNFEESGSSVVIQLSITINGTIKITTKIGKETKTLEIDRGSVVKKEDRDIPLKYKKWLSLADRLSGAEKDSFLDLVERSIDGDKNAEKIAVKKVMVMAKMNKIDFINKRQLDSLKANMEENN